MESWHTGLQCLFRPDVRRDHARCAVMGAIWYYGIGGGAVCKNKTIFENRFKTISQHQLPHW